MNDIFGKVLAVILSFVLVVIAPVSIATMMKEMNDRRSIINEVSNLIDEVADTKTLTDDQLEDFYLGVSSYGPLVDAKVYRYVRVINPDPKNPNKTYTTYVVTDNTSTWNQGDICKVKIDQIGYTGMQKFVMNTIGTMMPDFHYAQAGRVR